MNSVCYPKAVISALIKADLKTANELLGKEYYITGIVIRGQMLGRTLGFPTANLIVSAETPLLIPNGVYAVRIVYSESIYLGMANIGTRPTINGKSLTVEVNLFDFNDDLYGQTLNVYFVCRIRDEKKFKTLEGLTRKIARDKIRILELFSLTSQPDSNA